MPINATITTAEDTGDGVLYAVHFTDGKNEEDYSFVVPDGEDLGAKINEESEVFRDKWATEVKTAPVRPDTDALVGQVFVLDDVKE